MKTRTEQEMMALILTFAQNDERIRAVLMNGSRVNPCIPKDIFQDYDIVNVVTEVAPFKEKSRIISHFGDPIIIQTPEEKIDPPAVGDGRYNYNMQFIDGNRIDLSFFHLTRLDELLQESLTKVLLDKDQRILSLPAPSESSYLIKAPTEQRYGDCCDEFLFGLGSHIPKTIWRKELPLLKVYIEVVLRQPLLKMLAWELAMTTDTPLCLGKANRHLQRYLPPDVWNEYIRTYTDANYDRLWESLFLFHRLFTRSAKSVGQHYGFRFPEEESGKVMRFLTHVKQLPQDAPSIY